MGELVGMTVGDTEGDVGLTDGTNVLGSVDGATLVGDVEKISCPDGDAVKIIDGAVDGSVEVGAVGWLDGTADGC